MTDLEMVAYEKMGGSVTLKNKTTGSNLEGAIVRREKMDAPNGLNYGVLAIDYKTGSSVCVSLNRETLLHWLEAAITDVRGN